MEPVVQSITQTVTYTLSLLTPQTAPTSAVSGAATLTSSNAITGTNDFLAFLGKNKDTFSSVQSIITFIAIIIGAVWTYKLFVQRREIYPRVEITHKLEHFPITDYGKVLVRLIVTISNKGQTLASFATARVQLEQMIPWTEDFLDTIANGDDPVLVEEGEREVLWTSPEGCLPRIYADATALELETEPGVSEDLHFEFVINDDVEVIKAYSYFRNLKKRQRFGWKGIIPGRYRQNIGWGTTTVYRLKTTQEQEPEPVED